ncbi:MAG: polysaccharide pyruvyl transferase family protein [Weeksellaceae bacterium]
MKKAIIYYKNSDNIGDDIQTYAALKLLGRTDYFLDREQLNKKSTEANTKLLCNGWFMKNPQNWPPHSNLIPLFISLYIDHKHGCHKYMLNDDLNSYYKKFGPIGCRDKHTLNLFQGLNIPSYFSGCVTLTLPKYEGEKSEEILLVDPFVKVFDQKYVETQIQRIIPEQYENQVSILTHHDYDLKNLNIAQRMDKAEKLLNRYAKAKLIITSRIHCALPATAMGTPVYFMNVGYDRPHALERLDGLLDLFEVINDRHFPVGNNQPMTKIRRKLGLYTKKKIEPNPIDFKLKPATLSKFQANFKKAEKLARHIRDTTDNFFET